MSLDSTKHFAYIIFFSFTQQIGKQDIFIILILQKPRFREFKELAQSHTASEWQDLPLKPVLSEARKRGQM